MKPAPFEYHRPSDVQSALKLLADLEDVELMAGNQSLGIVMANRLATPDHLVDLADVEDLRTLVVDENRARIGAMVTHRTIERSTDLAERVPMLPAAAEQIAGPSVRNQGTMGGSIAEADPAGNYPTALLALEGTIHLASVDDERTVPAEEFFVAYMFTDLGPDELITATTVDLSPWPADRTGMAFIEQKRGAQTFPTISGAAVVRVDDTSADEPVVERARVALANAADVPLRVSQAETALEGSTADGSALETAAEAGSAAADPAEEMHADREFKTEVAGEYTRRALQLAYDRAVGAATRDASDEDGPTGAEGSA